MNGVEQFAIGVVSICVIIMRGVGVIDDLFTDLMIRAGLTDPTWQLGVLFAVLAFYVVLSLRAVGGMLGWAMLFFAVLLLLHRAAPSLTGINFPVATQLEKTL
jgi:hypothetical protein